MRRAIVLLLLLVATPAAAAEPTPAWPVNQRHAADILSGAALGAQVWLDSMHSLRADHRGQALREQGLALGITIGLSEVLKRVVHRERPDGSDRLSWPSEHTAIAAAAGGWSFGISASLTELVAVGRMGANKHHPSDVASGAAIGTLARLGARALLR